MLITISLRSEHTILFVITAHFVSNYIIAKLQSSRNSNEFLNFTDRLKSCRLQLLHPSRK